MAKNSSATPQNANPPPDDYQLPEGVELEDLSPDFEPILGFLVVPRTDKATGSIKPKGPVVFTGIVADVVPYTDDRNQPRQWFAMVATADQQCLYFDGESNEQNPVKKGDRIGVSGTGAINSLKNKKGHFAHMTFTGNKVAVRRGEMWEVLVKVSTKPVLKEDGSLPF